MNQKSNMKGKNDSGESLPPDQSLAKTDITPDASSMASFLQQEKMCKELYLSMGVHPSDIADTSDDDVASILEQMSRLQPSGPEYVGGGDRNIEDILKEAESLLDGQQVRFNSRLTSKSFSSKSGSEISSSFHHSDSAKCSNHNDQHYFDTGQNSHQRLTNVTQTLDSSALDTDKVWLQTEGCSKEEPQPVIKVMKGYEAFMPSHLVGTPLEVTYKRIYEQIRKEVGGSLKTHLTGEFPDLRLSLPIPGLETPSNDVPGCFNLEQEFLEERKRCLKLKADLDWLKRQHEREVAELRRRHEGQLNQIREELSSSNNQNPSIVVLQNELEAQETVIIGYQQENEKMCTELKDIKRALLKLMALLKADNDSVCIFP